MTTADARPDRIRIENVNHPGKSTTVDAAMYHAMRTALLSVLPTTRPGLTQAQMLTSVVKVLPDDLFPGGDKAGWWAKSVQLDLEAKGEITREISSPLRWHRLEEAARPSATRTSRDGGSPHLRNGGVSKP